MMTLLGVGLGAFVGFHLGAFAGVAVAGADIAAGDGISKVGGTAAFAAPILGAFIGAYAGYRLAK